MRGSRLALRPVRVGVIVCLMLFWLILPVSLTLRADDATAATSRQIDQGQNYLRHCCAGWPQCVSRWARPSYGCHESGYYVGGGAAFCGDTRCPHEGTFGWDYNGRLFQKRIALGWHHGRRSQGGVGAYRTDGH